MVTETKTDLERYIRRLLPAELRPGAPPPATWDRSDMGEWEEVRAAAEVAFRSKAAWDFAYGIAVQGYYVQELVEGLTVDMDGTGKVKRPPRSDINPELAARCFRVLGEIRDLQAPVDEITRSDLYNASIGRGEPGQVLRKLEGAEATVAARRAELDAARRAQASQPIFSVPSPFDAMGKHYTAGTMPITPAEAARLEEWERRMNAGPRDEFEPHKPLGFGGRPWPAFTIMTPAPA